MNKVVFILALAITSLNLHAESPVIYDPDKDKQPPVEMSSGNECDKKIKKLEEKINCYKCCTGESPKDKCKDFKNFNFCKDKKSCNCG